VDLKPSGNYEEWQSCAAHSPFWRNSEPIGAAPLSPPSFDGYTKHGDGRYEVQQEATVEDDAAVKIKVRRLLFVDRRQLVTLAEGYCKPTLEVGSFVGRYP
jgi:hypothetical protein